MGADGHLTLARIGDGQCWLKNDIPRIMIKEPTAVFLKDAKIWCDEPKKIYTYSGDIHITHFERRLTHQEQDQRYSEDTILGDIFTKRHGGFGRSAIEQEFSIMWCPVSWIREHVPKLFDQAIDSTIFSVPAQEHFDAWGKLSLGLWVPIRYLAAGCDRSWSTRLDERCEIKGKVTWEVWT